MPDSMDRVQQLADDHAADALKRHSSRPRLAGRSTCGNLDCGEGISSERQALGAQLCLTCQRAEEAVAAHQRTWRGR